MLNLGNLKSVIEKKSGRHPISCDIAGLRSRLGYDIDSMRQNGFDPSVIEEHQTFNNQLEEILGNSEILEYLCNLTPEEIYLASGVRILTTESIREEIQQLAPSARLFPFGYLPIASSIGGNVICYHSPTKRILWADHSRFGGDLTADKIEKVVIPLAEDLAAFLNDLLSDKLEKQLDKLD